IFEWSIAVFALSVAGADRHDSPPSPTARSFFRCIKAIYQGNEGCRHMEPRAPFPDSRFTVHSILPTWVERLFIASDTRREADTPRHILCVCVLQRILGMKRFIPTYKRREP